MAKDWSLNLSGHETKADLIKIYNHYYRRANAQMENWYKKGSVKESPAYRNLVEPLKGTSYVRSAQAHGEEVARFYRLPKNATMGQVKTALRAAESFLTSKTSNRTAYNALIRERQKSIQEALPGLTKDEADGLLRWMGSEEGKNAMKNFDSHQMRRAIGVRMKQRKKEGLIADAYEAYKDFLASQTDLANFIRQNSGGESEF